MRWPIEYVKNSKLLPLSIASGSVQVWGRDRDDVGRFPQREIGEKRKANRGVEFRYSRNRAADCALVPTVKTCTRYGV